MAPLTCAELVRRLQTQVIAVVRFRKLTTTPLDAEFRDGEHSTQR
jgi:hypothetical protein